MPASGGRPLAGRRFLVVAPEGREAYWGGPLRARGAVVEALALTRHEALSDDAARPLDDWLLGAASDEDVVLTSAEGVRRLAARAAAVGVSPVKRLAAPSRVVAIGPATAAALAALGRPADRVAAEARSEGVVAVLRDDDRRSPGRRVTIVRAAAGRSELPDGLAAAGFGVTMLAAYRTVIIPGAAERAAACLSDGDAVDAVVVTSAAPLAALADVVPALRRASVPVVALGPVTADAARALGFAVIGTAAGPTPDALAAAVENSYPSR
jgi:uroporphyrinogen-III synthase